MSSTPDEPDEIDDPEQAPDQDPPHPDVGAGDVAEAPAETDEDGKA